MVDIVVEVVTSLKNYGDGSIVRTDFYSLPPFCPKILGLSQQFWKEMGLLFGMRTEKDLSLHQKSFFIQNIY